MLFIQFLFLLLSTPPDYGDILKQFTTEEEVKASRPKTYAK